MPQRGCDGCGSRDRRLLHEQRFVGFDDDAGLSGYDVVVCETCGFVYADGLPEMSVFERYYRELSKYDPNGRDEPVPAFKRHNYELIVAEVARRLPNRAARILDVGSASGELLVVFREHGYTDLTGIDPSPRCAEIARRQHGLRVLTTTISQLESSCERYDLILLAGVLEHVRDLRATLGTLKSLLREGGRLWLAVPDAARFTEDMASPYQHLSLEHINFFTRHSLAQLSSNAGLQLESSWDTTHLVGVMKEPTLNGIFAPAAIASSTTRDEVGEREVTRYLARSQALRAELEPKLRALAAAGEPIIVWGLGSLTMLLLGDPAFEALRIVAFVDANRNYWGKTIRGIPVVSPGGMQRHAERILVASHSYEAEIVAQIKERYRLANDVIRLFATARSLAAS